jgi:hypothetical protein
VRETRPFSRVSGPLDDWFGRVETTRITPKYMHKDKSTNKRGRGKIIANHAITQAMKIPSITVSTDNVTSLSKIARRGLNPPSPTTPLPRPFMTMNLKAPGLVDHPEAAPKIHPTLLANPRLHFPPQEPIQGRLNTSCKSTNGTLNNVIQKRIIIPTKEVMIMIPLLVVGHLLNLVVVETVVIIIMMGDLEKYGLERIPKEV